jgi:hypothetical protein
LALRCSAVNRNVHSVFHIDQQRRMGAAEWVSANAKPKESFVSSSGFRCATASAFPAISVAMASKSCG